MMQAEADKRALKDEQIIADKEKKGLQQVLELAQAEKSKFTD